MSKDFKLKSKVVSGGPNLCRSDSRGKFNRVSVSVAIELERRRIASGK